MRGTAKIAWPWRWAPPFLDRSYYLFATNVLFQTYVLFVVPQSFLITSLCSLDSIFNPSRCLPLSQEFSVVHINMYHTLHVVSRLCYRTVTPCVAVIVCDVEFGYWVCGESWLAIKDSLTHRPSSQGWAPSVLLSCHVMCICVCVFIDVLGFVDNILEVVFIYLFLYLSIYIIIPMAGMLWTIISCIDWSKVTPANIQSYCDMLPQFLVSLPSEVSNCVSSCCTHHGDTQNLVSTMLECASNCFPTITSISARKLVGCSAGRLK